jgi:hypothetical protein
VAGQPWNGAPQPWQPPQSPQPWQASQSPQAAQAAMRASHADRERTVDVLKAAYAEGRLVPEEYGQRVEAVYRALTYGELARLVADLPSGPLVLPMALPAPAAQMVPPTFLPPPVPASPTNGLAVTSLVLGFCGFVPFASVAAVATGLAAKQRIRQTGEQGDGIATAGLVLGWMGVAFWVLLLLVGASA